MVARGFMISSVIYGLIGLAIGLHMAISGDHGQMPTHAHLQVLAWLSFFAFGLFYTLIPAAAAGLLPKAQFWIAQLSAPVMLIGVWGLHADMPQLEPAAALGSIAYSVSFLIFAVIVFRSGRPAMA